MDLYQSDGSVYWRNRDDTASDSESGEADSTGVPGNKPPLLSSSSSSSVNNKDQGNRIPDDWTLLESTAPRYATAASGPGGKEVNNEQRRQAAVLHHQLIDASKKGSVARVEKLIADGANVDQQDNLGNAALHHAAKNRHFLLVGTLIECGADVGIANHSGCTAMMLAARERHGAIVELLADYRGGSGGQHPGNASSSGQGSKPDLSHFQARANSIGSMPEKDRADALVQAVADKDVPTAARMIASGDISVEEIDDRGLTLLARASEKGDAPMIRLLLCAGAKLEAVDRALNTPLMQAVINKNPDAITALLKAGANTAATNRDRDSVLALAINTDHPLVIHALAKGKADVWNGSVHGVSPVSAAASKGKTKAVATLLQLNADVRDLHGALALADRAKNNDLLAVRTLLAAGADPLDKAGDGHGAFTLAVANGHTDVVDALLAHVPTGTSANPASMSTRSAAAPRTEDPAWVRLLLRQTDNHGRTALMLAACNNKVDMAKALLNKKADPHETDQAGRNALLWAAMNAGEPMLTLLMGHRLSHASTDARGNTALITAAENGNQVVAEVLCRPIYNSAGCNIDTPNKDGDTALIVASRRGLTDMVALLLGKGADPMRQNKLGRTALFEAVGNGHAPVVSLLRAATSHMVPAASIIDYALRAIANLIPVARNFMPAPQTTPAEPVDMHGNTMLHRASYHGKTAMVRSLLYPGMPVHGAATNVGENALAALQNPVAVAARPAGPDIEALNKRGLTPLCMAVAGGDYSTIALLLEAGANVNHTAGDGATPLWLASRLGAAGPAVSAPSSSGTQAPSTENIVGLLLGSGAAIDAPSFNGQTPLIAAAASGNTGVLVLLIDRGADTGKTDINGATALMHAAYCGHENAVLALLNAGARLNSANFQLSALTLAAQGGHDRIVSLLIKRGANINHIGPDRATALIAASKAGKLAPVKLLLAQGARLDRVDDDHKDALYHAEKSGNPALADLLKAGYPKPRDQ